MPLAYQGGRQDRPDLTITRMMAADLGAEGFKALANQMQQTAEAETGKPHAWWLHPLTQAYHLFELSPVHVRITTPPDTC